MPRFKEIALAWKKSNKVGGDRARARVCLYLLLLLLHVVGIIIIYDDATVCFPKPGNASKFDFFFVLILCRVASRLENKHSFLVGDFLLPTARSLTVSLKID